MNIIVTNQNKDLIYGANIEIMKELNGVFQVSEIANSFNSIFYKKLIIDATALENFPKEDVLRKLAKTFDTEKLILFLPPNDPPPKKFLSLLVSINIYNFTDNIKGLQELVAKSNTYDDVKEYVVQNTPARKEISYEDFSDSNISLDNEQVILGIKNVTKNAGSTALTYMLKKNLQEAHNKEVVAVELDKRDFAYYNDKTMYSISNSKMGEFFATMSKMKIILVDLADSNKADFCTDVIYLVEPSLYRINQLMMGNRAAFNMLKGKKVILSNSLLNDNDVNTFAREAGISLYFNLPPLNDRIVNPVLNDLLSKLGLVDVQSSNQGRQKRGLFDIFK